PPPRRAAAADGDVGATPPARRRGDHRAVELPADAERLRRRARAGGRQRRRAQARQADAVQRAARRGAARGGRAPCRTHAGRHRLGRGARAALDRGLGLRDVHRQHGARAPVDDAVAKGARVVAGGRHRPALGPYSYEPTLLESVRDGMSLFRDETFGPVVSISRFSSEDEAVARANDSDYGLNFSVWTR